MTTVTLEKRSKYAQDVYVNQVPKSQAYKAHIDPQWSGNTSLVTQFEKTKKMQSLIKKTQEIVQNSDEEIKKMARSNLLKALRVSENLLDSDDDKIKLQAAGQVYQFSTAVMGIGARKEEEGLKKRPFL